MREREQTAVPELAIRALETRLCDVADAFASIAAALAGIDALAGKLVDGSTLTLTLASHMTQAAVVAEKSVLAHGDELADQRLLRALRGFQLTIAEAATRPARGA